jgi:hypothetical protein
MLTQHRGDFIEENYADALDRLAHAAAPNRFSKTSELAK